MRNLLRAFALTSLLLATGANAAVATITAIPRDQYSRSIQPTYVVPVNPDGTPAGSTANNNSEGSATGGTAATASTLAGGIYNVVKPVLTDGQQSGLQLGPNGSLSVGGLVADAVTATGLPVPAGAIYESTLPTYTTGQRTTLHADPKGSLNVNLLDNAGNNVATGNPNADGVSTTNRGLNVRNFSFGYNGTTWDRSVTLPGVPTTGLGLSAAGLASIYNSTLPTYTTGQYGALQMGTRGSLSVTLFAPDSANSITSASTNSDTIGVNATTNALRVVNYSYMFNGTSYDRMRSASGAIGLAGSGLATEPAGQLFSNITTATTTTAKSGAGILHKITVNTFVASATITVYDNTAASGTKIATITLPSTITGVVPYSIEYDLAFATGLTLVTSGATDLTVTYR